MNNNELVSPARRNLLLGAGAMAALAATGAKASEDSHHHHHSTDTEMLDASLACVKTGQLCLNHCLGEFQKGNADMAGCAASVQQMLAMCGAFSTMVSLESAHLAKTAQACIDVCEDCVQACKKHADKHQVCKDCMHACKDCIKQMKKVA